MDWPEVSTAGCPSCLRTTGLGEPQVARLVSQPMQLHPEVAVRDYKTTFDIDTPCSVRRIDVRFSNGYIASYVHSPRKLDRFEKYNVEFKIQCEACGDTGDAVVAMRRKMDGLW